MNLTKEQQAKKLQWKNEPEVFISEKLGINLWSKQIDIARSVRDNRYTVVKSGHSVGKTMVTACIALWFLYTNPNSIVIITAPTLRQVEGQLWKEISKLWKPYFGGEMSHLKLSITGDEWVMLGFTARESVDSEQMAARIQGYHADKVLVIFDEAAGVHPAFWTAKDAVLTSEGCRFLAIGNPTSPSGPFYDAFRNPNFNKLSISCLEHPNIIEGREIIPGAVTQIWINERKAEWGEHSAFYKGRILGEFPSQGVDALFNLEDLFKCLEREVPAATELEVKTIGVDVAREGDDKTVITLLQGDVVIYQDVYQGFNTVWTSGRIKELDSWFKADLIAIDDTGVGGGVTDNLIGYIRQSDKKTPRILGINFASADSTKKTGALPLSTQSKHLDYENVRAEMYYEFSRAVRQGSVVLKKQDDEKAWDPLINELASVKVDFSTGSGKIKILAKKDMKKLGLKSPDHADSLVLAWYAKLQGIKRAAFEENASENILGDNFLGLFRK